MEGKVSVIVRCLDEEAHIGRLLSGIERQSLVPDEVVVVDSGSTDASVAIASRFGARIVEIAPEDFSFGRALNLGIGSSIGDVAVLASAHVYPIYDSWLERLVEPIATDPSVAVAYGRQVTPPDGRFSELRLMQQWFPESSVMQREHPFHNNANAAIRRTEWESRSYDESLTGLEDLDFGRHMIESGKGIAYVAEAPVVHVHDESFSQIRNRYRREAIAHRRIYSDQAMSAASAIRLGAANVVGDLKAATRERRLAAEAAGILQFRTAQFLGTWEGFRHEGPVTRALRERFYYPARQIATSDGSDSEGIGNPLEYDEPAVGTGRDR